MATISFNDLAAWCDQKEDKLYDTVSEYTKDVFGMLIRYSPSFVIGANFSTGHFIHNWQFGSKRVLNEIGGTSTIGEKINEINSTFTKEYFKVNNQAHASNNTEYANHVENVGWKVTLPYSPLQNTVEQAQGGAPMARTTAYILGKYGA